MERFEPEEVGAGIEAVLEELRSAVDEATWEQVTTLVGLLTDLYGSGLARTVELADDPQLLGRLSRDELVGSLLALHGLHPEPLETRAHDATLAAGDALAPLGARVRLAAVDPATSAVTVTVTARSEVADRAEATVRHLLGAAAPEATVEFVVRAPPLQHPPAAAHGAEPVAVRLGPVRARAEATR